MEAPRGDPVQPVERQDVEAAVHARREFGPAYDDEIVDSLLAKIDDRLAERRPAAVARHGVGAAAALLLLGMFGCGVGATAVALTHGADWVAAVIWLALGYAAREILRR